MVVLWFQIDFFSLNAVEWRSRLPGRGESAARLEEASLGDVVGSVSLNIAVS
jgi:hypothetical protein